MDLIPNCFVAIFMIISLLQFTKCGGKESKFKEDHVDVHSEKGLKGDLYEVFKKRLDTFNKDMTCDTLPSEGTGKRSTVREGLYEEFKKRLDKINNELSLDGEKVFDRSGRTITDRIQPRSVDEKNSGANNVNNDPMHTLMNEDLYDTSRERLDKMNNEHFLKDIRYQDRSDRSLVHGFDETFNGAVADENPLNNDKVPAIFNSNDYGSLTNVANYTTNWMKFYNNEPTHINKWSNLRRRQVKAVHPPAAITSPPIERDLTVSYPTVLTKALEVNMNGSIPSSSFLSNVASKLNTSTLELAHKLVGMSQAESSSLLKNDPQIKQLLEKYITNLGNATKIGRDSKTPVTASLRLPMAQSPFIPPVKSELQPMQTKVNNAAIPQVDKTTAIRAIPAIVPINGQKMAGPVSVPVVGPVPARISVPVTAPAHASTPQVSSAGVNSGALLVSNTGGTPSALQRASTDTSQGGSQDSPQVGALDGSADSDGSTLDASNQINTVLDKVLKKLQRIQGNKSNGTEGEDGDPEAEGASCDVVGNWTSYVVGLSFRVTDPSDNKDEPVCIPVKANTAPSAPSAPNATATAAEPHANATVADNIILTISVNKTTPPKENVVIDEFWKFTGNTMKRRGGPFFIMSGNKSAHVLATFSGICRRCGQTDTIFGSWTFVFPSNDCTDVTVSIETKRDIFRRDSLDEQAKNMYDIIEMNTSGKCKSKAHLR